MKLIYPRLAARLDSGAVLRGRLACLKTRFIRVQASRKSRLTSFLGGVGTLDASLLLLATGCIDMRSFDIARGRISTRFWWPGATDQGEFTQLNDITFSPQGDRYALQKFGMIKAGNFISQFPGSARVQTFDANVPNVHQPLSGRGRWPSWIEAEPSRIAFRRGQQGQCLRHLPGPAWAGSRVRRHGQDRSRTTRCRVCVRAWPSIPIGGQEFIAAIADSAKVKGVYAGGDTILLLDPAGTEPKKITLSQPVNRIGAPGGG